MNRIRQLRKEQGMKQIELSKLMGISQATLSGWENERFDPDINAITRLATIFGVTIDYLLGGPDMQEPASEDDLWEIREHLRRTPEMRTLFDMSKNATRADIEKTVSILKMLKGDK